MRTAIALVFVLVLSVAAPSHAQPGGPGQGMHAVAAASDADKAAFDKTNITTDVTDVWWPDAESGWGIFFIHNNDLIFATMFVYGAGNVPTFYIAVLANTPSGSGTWTGDLSATTGSPFSAPWNPAAATETVVGTMTFTLTGIGTGTLAYNVGPSNVSKTLNRQPLKLENNAGDYLLTDTFAGGSGCGTGSESGTLNIVQTGTAATLTINWSGNICTFPTTYSQLGRLGQYLGTMSCSNGTTGTANFFEVHNRVKMVNGRYNISNSFGCTYTGRFAAIAPTP
jgi:hypothetical protein